MKIEDCKTVSEFFGVNPGESIWIDGIEYTVGSGCLVGECTTGIQDARALVGCLTGELKWSTELPKPQPNKEEAAILRETAKLEDAWCTLDLNGVKCRDYIWINGTRFEVSNVTQNIQALVGCLTGQLELSTEPPKPELNDDEVAILKDLAKWLSECDVLYADKSNDIIATNKSSPTFCYPFGFGDSRQSYGYNKLTPILKKYGEIDLKKFRTGDEK